MAERRFVVTTGAYGCAADPALIKVVGDVHVVYGFEYARTSAGCWHVELAVREGDKVTLAELCLPSEHHLRDAAVMFGELADREPARAGDFLRSLPALRVRSAIESLKTGRSGPAERR